VTITEEGFNSSEFKSEGVHEKHAVATGNSCIQTEGILENLCSIAGKTCD
jgi:hypothetical protein